MKKILFSFATLFLGALTFVSCSNDDDIQPADPITISNGAFVVCEGNLGSKIPGSVSYLDYRTGFVVNNTFLQVNGRVLGGTVNHALIYGSKIYFVSTDDNTIEVTDRNLRSINQVKTTDLLGKKKGINPRHLVADGGRIYFTTYGKCLAAIDTVAFSLKDSIQVGDHPEGFTVANGKVLVANSYYGTGKGTISIVDFARHTSVEKKVEGIYNPQDMYVVGNDIYVLDWGEYGDASQNYAQIEAGLKQVVAKNGKDVAETVVANATQATLYRQQFYTINAPYGAGKVTYGVYQVATKKTTALNIAVDSPKSIAVDPQTGNLFITSYTMQGGWPAYSKPGYLQMYSATGKKLNRYNVGVGPSTILFNTEVH